MAGHAPGAGPSLKLCTPESDERDMRAARREIHQAIGTCRGLLQNRFVSARTREAYEQMFTNDPKFRQFVEQGEVREVQRNVDWIREMINDAQASYEEFRGALDVAVTGKWISPASRERWIGRFWNGDTLEFARKSWIREHFPAYVERWKEAAARRTQILDDAAAKGIKPGQLPALARLADDAVFLDIDYNERKGMLGEAAAAVAAHRNGVSPLMEEVQRMLLPLTLGANRCLHPSKVGLWLDRVFSNCKTEMEVRTFLAKVLDPYVANWRRARADFHTLGSDMSEKGVPRGFQPVSLDTFLLWDYDRRASYLAEARLRLEAKEGTDRRLNGLKLGIRHNLDTQDWEGATRDLEKAKEIAPWDIELRSMEAYLRAHRTEAHRQRDVVPHPQVVVDELRGLLAGLPTELQWIYTEAMMEGPEVFNRLLQTFYNRVWVHEHGYADEEDDREQARSDFNKRKTQEYTKEGHTKQLERNIVDGDTAKTDAIRDDCRSPQLLYMANMGQEAVLAKVRKNAGNEDFGYWTTIVPSGVSYNAHHNVVKHMHYPMKSKLRFLADHGFRFTPTGAVQTARGAERAAA